MDFKLFGDVSVCFYGRSQTHLADGYDKIQFAQVEILVKGEKKNEAFFNICEGSLQMIFDKALFRRPVAKVSQRIIDGCASRLAKSYLSRFGHL